MIQPEQKPKETTQYEGAREEPLELRDSHQTHQKKAKHYHETDGVCGPFTPAIRPEGDNLAEVWFGAVRNNSPPVTNLKARGNHHLSV